MNYTVFFKILSFFFIPIGAGLLSLLSPDFYNYRSLHDNIPEFEVSTFFWVEPGFYILFLVSKFFAVPFWLFSFVVVYFTVFTKMLLLHQLSRSFWISVLIYTSWFMILQDTIQIRVSLGLVFGIYSVYFFSVGRIKQSLLFVFFAFLFHYSLAFILLVYLSIYFKVKVFKNISHSVYFISLVFFGMGIGLSGGLVSFILEFLPLFLQTKVRLYVDHSISAPIISLKVMVFFVISLILLSFDIRVLDKFSRLWIHAFFLGFSIYFAFSDVLALAIRSSEVFLFGLVFIFATLRDILKPPVLYFLLVCVFSVLSGVYYIGFLEVYK